MHFLGFLVFYIVFCFLIYFYICPHSRLGHTSDIHSHSYSSVGFFHPAANITDISCLDGLHLQFFFCVSVFSDNWPSSARRCSAESSPLPGQWCTCYCVVLWVGYIVCSYAPMVWLFSLNHAGTTTVHIRLGTSSVLPVNLLIWGLSSQCASCWLLNVFTVLLLTTS